MRFHSGWGIVAFALTLTFSGVLWMQAVQYQWFSAVYGVYLFASYAWAALAAVYIITVLLQRQRILDRVLHDNQFYYLGLLFFAFTIFQAYNEFAQYFVIWNANMPSETFWYLIRENGSWWWVSLLLIFGHFLLPFFVLLPVKAKTRFQNHAAGLRVGAGDELPGPGVQHPADAASGRLSVQMDSGCSSDAWRSWADFSVGRF